MMARKYGNDDCNGHGECMHVIEYELVYYTRSRPMGTQEIRQYFDPGACEDPFMKTLGPLVSQKYMDAVTGSWEYLESCLAASCAPQLWGMQLHFSLAHFSNFNFGFSAGTSQQSAVACKGIPCDLRTKEFRPEAKFVRLLRPSTILTLAFLSFFPKVHTGILAQDFISQRSLITFEVSKV